MNIKDFDEIIHIRAEIEMLKKRLEKVKNPDIASDYAKDYSTGHERIISIVGFPLPNKVKSDKILDMITKRVERLEAKVLEAEEYINSIPESRVRLLLTLKYIEGKTWDEAAKTVYKKMSESAARKFIKRYFEKL